MGWLLRLGDVLASDRIQFYRGPHGFGRADRRLANRIQCPCAESSTAGQGQAAVPDGRGGVRRDGEPFPKGGSLGEFPCQGRDPLGIRAGNQAVRAADRRLGRSDNGALCACSA